MPKPILLPKLGNTVESAIILAWHIAVGEPVQAGDVICEVETDKAAMEVESGESGILLAQLARVGDEVPVLSQIAWVGEPGEAIDPVPKDDSSDDLMPSSPQSNPIPDPSSPSLWRASQSIGEGRWCA